LHLDHCPSPNLIKSFCHRLEEDSERAARLLQLAPKCSPYSATARSTISTRRQALVLAKGRHWAMVTRSPCLHSLVSSWAWIFVERRTYLPYIGCGTLRSTHTVMVLFIMSLTTRPVSLRIIGGLLGLLGRGERFGLAWDLRRHAFVFFLLAAWLFLGDPVLDVTL